MFRMRPAHTEALAHAAMDDYVDRVMVHLRTVFPTRLSGTDDGALDAIVRRGITAAGEHGVTIELDVCRYLECVVAFGEDFTAHDAYDPAGTILHDRELTGTEKMDRVEAALAPWRYDHAPGQEVRDAG